MFRIAKYASFITIANKLLNKVPVSKNDLPDGSDVRFEIKDILDFAKRDLEDDAYSFCRIAKANGVMDLNMCEIIRELNCMLYDIKKYVPGYEDIETANLFDMYELVNSHTLKNY